MSLKGNLSSVNLTEIFQMLSLSGREGTLYIYEGTRKRAICFNKEGVSIRSRERNENVLIGKILVRLGKLDEAELQQAVEARRTGDKLIGDILVDSGFCLREDVECAFAVQSQEEIQDLFLFYSSDAQFEYVDEYFPETELPFVHLNVNALLIEIARRTDEWEYIRRRIRGPREIYHFTGTEGQIDAQILEECFADRIDPLIDGAHSVREIIERSYVNKFEVCKLLAAYLDAEVIELVPHEVIRQNASLALRMGDAESAIRHYEYLMSSGDFPLEIMAEAAGAHEANRDYDEAATLLRRLAEELLRSGGEAAAIESLHRVANYPRPQPEALSCLLDLVFANPKAAAEYQANVVEAGKTLAAYHLQQEQRHEATLLLERLVKTFPDEVAFAVSLVNVYYDEGMVEKAVSECERLAAGYFKRRRTAPAVSLYKKLLVMDPERNDIRERIRKITTGGRKSRRGPGALPRVAVTLAVMLLLAGVALVVLRQEGNNVQADGGLDSETRTRLRGAAAQQQSLAQEHGENAIELYGSLSEMLRDAPLQHSEELLVGLEVVDKHLERFHEHAEKVGEIANTILQQAGLDEDLDRARAILASRKDLESRVDIAQESWNEKAQESAEVLFRQALRDYKGGEHRRALKGLVLALDVATDPDWAGKVQIDGFLRNIRGTINSVEYKLAQARGREESDDWTGARRILLDLLGDYGNSDLVKEILLPVEIVTVPPEASVTLDDKSVAALTPAIVRLDPFKATRVSVQKRGFLPRTEEITPFGEETDPTQYRHRWVLRKAAIWSRPTGVAIEADPVVCADRVVVAGRNGTWVILEAETGKLAKRGSLGEFDGVSANPVAEGSTVYLPTVEGRLFTIDARTGQSSELDLKRKSRFDAPPALANGVLYLVDHEGRATAIELSTRKRLWSEPALPAVHAKPVVLDAKHLVIVSLSGDVAVLDRATGKKLRSFTVNGGTFRCAPAKLGSDLLFASENGWLGRIDPLGGATLWEKPLPVKISRTPPVRGTAIFVSPAAGELIVISASTGNETFRVAGSDTPARATVQDTYRIFTVNGRELAAFAQGSDGYGLAWVFEAEGDIVVGPVVAGDSVYVGDSEGILHCLKANE